MVISNDNQSRDIVAQYPDEFAELAVKDHEQGIWLSGTVGLNERHFIHARATLPLKDIESDLGFGLWVEVKKEDLEKYKEALDDDEKYKKFEAEGILANSWPGFENTLGIKVKIKTIHLSEKVYITDVFPDNTSDPLFRIALTMQKHQIELKNQVRKLIVAWMNEYGTTNTQSSN